MYTDGACAGNPGPGGHAAVLVYEGHHKIMSGRCTETTNNVEELLALLDGLRALKGPCRVTVVTDSRNVIGWLSLKFRRNDAGIAFLCAEIEKAVKDAGHMFVEFKHVRGHTGDKYNELADDVARREAETARAELEDERRSESK